MASSGETLLFDKSMYPGENMVKTHGEEGMYHDMLLFVTITSLMLALCAVDVTE